jgi:hypothetical protein
LHRDAARVDHANVGVLRLSLDEPAPAQEQGDLLALVLVDLAAERFDRKRFHASSAKLVA